MFNRLTYLLGVSGVIKGAIWDQRRRSGQFKNSDVTSENENLRWNLKNLSRGLNPPKSAKIRQNPVKFSAGLNLKTFDTIFSGTNDVWTAA